MESGRSLCLDERRDPLPPELLPLRLEELELECFKVVGEAGPMGWSSCMGPAGMVFIVPKVPRPGTKGDAGDKCSIGYIRYLNDNKNGRSDRLFYEGPSLKMVVLLVSRSSWFLFCQSRQGREGVEGIAPRGQSNRLLEGGKWCNVLEV